MKVWNAAARFSFILDTSVRNRSWLHAILGIAAIALSRIVFRSRLLYDLDSVNFALGMIRFNPTAHQPHPPGYFLYVCLGRLVNHFLPDPNTALVAIAIASSCGAAWMIYLLTREWFGREAALLSILLFLFSPLCWFHGIVALTYMTEAFFSALIGYWCWRSYAGAKAFIVPASIAFALAAGFRPSSALLLGPLWLFSVWKVGGIRMALAILAVAAVTLAWFLPMTAAAGGFHPYVDALTHLWSAIPGKRTTLASPWLAAARIPTIGLIFCLCFGSASILPFLSHPKLTASRSLRAGFVLVWIAPGLLFFSLVFLNFVNSGYLLVLCPPVFAWMAAGLYAFLARRDRRAMRWAAVIAGIAANCAMFFLAPLYCSYRSVRAFEANLTAITRDFTGQLNPEQILIVGFDSHFQGYRHAGYYLPHFFTVQYPEVSYPGGKRVFVMHERDTEVVRHLDYTRFDRFGFFPLPEGKDYAAYLDAIESKLPQGALRIETLGRQEIPTGPISLLPLLFPQTTR